MHQTGVEHIGAMKPVPSRGRPDLPAIPRTEDSVVYPARDQVHSRITDPEQAPDVGRS